MSVGGTETIVTAHPEPARPASFRQKIVFAAATANCLKKTVTVTVKHVIREVLSAPAVTTVRTSRANVVRTVRGARASAANTVVNIPAVVIKSHNHPSTQDTS